MRKLVRRQDSRTPLHNASYYVEVVCKLLAAGAAVNAVDKVSHSLPA
jgi:hypothetical protein